MISLLRKRIDLTEKIAKIIGHPVMIGDVMEYFYGSVRFSEWGKCWRKLTKPIEDQSTECIDFVYDLISKNYARNLWC